MGGEALHWMLGWHGTGGKHVQCSTWLPSCIYTPACRGCGVGHHQPSTLYPFQPISLLSAVYTLLIHRLLQPHHHHWHHWHRTTICLKLKYSNWNIYGPSNSVDSSTFKYSKQVWYAIDLFVSDYALWWVPQRSRRTRDHPNRLGLHINNINIPSTKYCCCHGVLITRHGGDTRLTVPTRVTFRQFDVGLVAPAAG